MRVSSVQRRAMVLMAAGCLAVVCVSSVAGAQRAEARGRWIFRYDRSGEQPPVGRAQPDFVGVIAEVAETHARQWGLRVRIEQLDGTQRSIAVTESTLVDGQPAKQMAATLAQGVPLAVFGDEVRGSFRATALFIISQQDWNEIVGDAQRRSGTLVPAPRAAGYEWDEESAQRAAGVEGLPWPARAWQPRYRIPEPRAAERPARPRGPTPMERVRRADLSGTIRSVRAGGRELSVATPGAVIIVLLDDATTVRRDGEPLTAGELREGDIVDVAVAAWRGSESCTAKQIWIVSEGAPAAP